MACSARIVKSFNFFPKRSNLDLWQGSEYAYLSITTHWPAEWPWNMYCMWHIQRILSFIVNSGILSHKNFIKIYSGVFRTLFNAHILRTCHIQNFAIFRILAYSEPYLFRYVQAYSIVVVIITLTFFFLFYLKYFWTKFKRFSPFYNMSARHEQHECDTSETQATRVQRECYTNNTSATRVKYFDFDKDTSKNIFFTPIY